MEANPSRRRFLASLGIAAGATAGASTRTSAQSTPPATGTWPTFGYDTANTGHNPVAAGISGDPGGDWVDDVAGTVAGSPAVAEGFCYFGTTDGMIYGVDAAAGEHQWEVETGGAVRSSPAVADGQVYVGSDDGTLYAIDAVEGTVEWTVETSGQVRASPTVANGLVYIGSWDWNLYAIDPVEGTEVWSFETGAAIDGAAAVPSEDAAVEDSAWTDLVFVASRDGRVYGLDASSGEREWVYEVGEPIPGAPAVAEGRIFVGSLDQQVYGIDAASGEYRWAVSTGGAIVTSPAVAEGSVYVAVRDGSTSRIRQLATNGDEGWTAKAGGQLTAPAVANGLVYAGSRTGDVAAFEVGSGDQVWSVSTGSAVGQPLAVAGDRVFGGNTGGRFFSLVAGGDVQIATADSDPSDPADGDGGGSGPGGLSFLLWPASVLGLIAAILAGLYAAQRTGLLASIEETADSIGPDIDPDDPSDTSRPTVVWDLVAQDVIARAEETDRTAREDLLVTKYVDSDTLDAPVVAYEVESYRDEPTRVRLTDSVFDTAEARPVGDAWTLDEDELVFETVVEPGETVRTIVGRPDCPEDHLDDLLDGPEVAVDPTGDS